MTATTIWLRAESKPHERRTPLAPEHAGRLLDAGYRLVVERSSMRRFDDEEYERAGCEMAPEGSWRGAPEEAFVLGLKELPDDGATLRHRHVYFAHAYKEQAGWRELLGRLKAGGGKLYDLEFLTDAGGRRVAAFGYWAGFAGAAVAVMNWCGQRLASDPVIAPLGSYASQDRLLDELRASLERVAVASTAANAAGCAAAGAGTGAGTGTGTGAGVAAGRPRVIVIGALGRTGTGATDLARSLDLECTGWDVEETRAGGPFREILDHDIFVNCVLIFSAVPPFVTTELLQEPDRRLGVIADVSCDPYGDSNPLPIYDRCTTFDRPNLRLRDDPPLDLVAIDHLPSMLPVESSRDYSSQLVGALLQLDGDADGVWRRALDLYERKIALLE